MPKTKSTKTLKAEKELASEVNKLTKQVQKLQNTELLKVYQKTGKFLFLSFMKGIMVGLGSVIGATVVVAILIYLLSQISFVPIIGDFINDLVGQLEIYQAE